eukprot:3387055-Pyramimonas_sp.AAC.2
MENPWRAALEKEEQEKTNTWRTAVSEKLQELARVQTRLESQNRQQVQQQAYQWALNHLIKCTENDKFRTTSTGPAFHWTALLPAIAGLPFPLSLGAGFIPHEPQVTSDGKKYIFNIIGMEDRQPQPAHPQYALYASICLLRNVLLSFMRNTPYPVHVVLANAPPPPNLPPGDGRQSYVTMRAAEDKSTTRPSMDVVPELNRFYPTPTIKEAVAAYFEEFIIHPIQTLCGCCPLIVEAMDEHGVYYTITPSWPSS